MLRAHDTELYLKPPPSAFLMVDIRKILSISERITPTNGLKVFNMDSHTSLLVSTQSSNSSVMDPINTLSAEEDERNSQQHSTTNHQSLPRDMETQSKKQDAEESSG